jgi:hypothetical protein
VKNREDNKPFVSVIGDFNVEGMTVFGRRAVTHWKPVLLVSRQIIRLFIYAVMYRDETGNWIVYLRSFASDDALAKLQATVVARRPKAPANKGNSKAMLDHSYDAGSVEHDEDLKFSFTGGILNQRATEQEVIESGNYLCLKDSQVRKLCVDKTLFEYSIEIKERT